jgi:hypothetical protein
LISFEIEPNRPHKFCRCDAPWIARDVKRAARPWFVTVVARLDEAPAISMGRAGIEPATLGLKVDVIVSRELASAVEMA